MADSPRIAELKRRVQSDPASIAFAALAEEYRRAGRYEEAIATSRHGLQRHPSYISAHVTLGRALLEVGDFDAARQELELVLRVAPENLAAIRGLAEIHHRSGQRAHAEAFSASHFDEMTATPAPETPAHEPSAPEPPDAPPPPPRIQLRPPAPHAAPAPPEGTEPPRVDLERFPATTQSSVELSASPAPLEGTEPPRVDLERFPATTQSSVELSASPAPPEGTEPPCVDLERFPATTQSLVELSASPADPAPAPLEEIEPPRGDLARVPAATQSSVAVSAPVDPALAPLEAFLEVILRTRESAQGVPLS